MLFFIIIFFKAYNTSRFYEPGITYQYKYSATVLLNEPPPLSQLNVTTKKTDVGYQVFFYLFKVTQDSALLPNLLMIDNR